MDKVLERMSANLGRNVFSLRTTKGLSQAQLAKIALIPRSTLTYLESGEGNPSLQNLVKIAAALQVGLEELLSPPRQDVQYAQWKDLPTLKKAGGKVWVRPLLPDPIPGMEMERIHFSPQSRLVGTPHVARTKEYLHCFLGRVSVVVLGHRYEVEEGGVLSFPGDERHVYENLNSKPAECFSVVSFAPWPGGLPS